MRRFALILVVAALATTNPAPEPKKYKPEVKETKTNSSLTNEERKFLREVEAKFGIKSDVQVEEKSDKQTTKPVPKEDLPKLPFPAVIAIEIVNDTDSKGKGKRTIDANLGYGYRTNTGYSYSYFGKPQEKGKFVLYPYSQEDIPPTHPNIQKQSYTNGQYTTATPNVEIQPSQAYELVPVKEEQSSSYEYKKPSTEFKSDYENVKGLESPPPPYSPGQSHTLYTTYNGEQFSGLSGKFPAVMPNYFIDSSQLLRNPQYQSAGLTSDYIRSHGAQLEQKVVPVLVLRIPSSYLKNPSAELYANLPQNYPISQYLNNVNLQELVNQYFAKIGYSAAPQIMSYNHSPLAASVSAPAAPVSSPASQYGPQHYANPYVRPSYTQADYSGVQYSAVQPVMARYPSKHSGSQYYMAPAQPIYHQQPIQNQQYEYQYQYVPSQEGYQQYYVNNVYPEYQQQISSHESHAEQAAADQQTSVQDAAAQAQYEETQALAQQQAHSGHEVPQTPHYRSQHIGSQQYEAESEYELPKEDSKNDSPTKVSVSAYSTPKPQYGSPQEQQQYYSAKEAIPKETLAIYPSSAQSQTIQRYQFDPQSGLSQNYYYQKQGDGDSSSKTIVISENYPSKDHNIATVLPFHKTTSKPNKPMQSVNYVTPVPFASKYQSRYNIMVPQTVIGGATNEKVSYVNSHSLPSHYLQSGTQYNPEEEYTTPLHHAPPRSSQKAPSYPRNYHSQPKRMVKPENKLESPSASSSRKRNEKNDKKKSA